MRIGIACPSHPIQSLLVDAAKALARHDRVLWVDADCAVDEPAEWPEGNFDVGYIANIHPAHKNRISAGFILFQAGPGAALFLRRWQQACNSASVDHGGLTRTIHDLSSHVKIENVTPWLEGRHTINAYLPERGTHRG